MNQEIIITRAIFAAMGTIVTTLAMARIAMEIEYQGKQKDKDREQSY